MVMVEVLITNHHTGECLITNASSSQDAELQKNVVEETQSPNPIDRTSNPIDRIPEFENETGEKSDRSDTIPIDRTTADQNESVENMQKSKDVQSRLKNTKTDSGFSKFLDVFKKLQINIPFAEALEQMPSYAKPFLRTGRTLIDVEKGTLVLRIADEEVTFKVFNTTKYPNDEESCLCIDSVDHILAHTYSINSCQDPLESCLVNRDALEYGDDEMVEFMNWLESMQEAKPRRFQRFEPLGVLSSRPQPSIIEAPTLTLKPLPSHLRYAYLGNSTTLPVIISSKLNTEEEDKLLRVLREHKMALGWTIADIRGISPTMCMHRILMEEDYKSSVEHQRRLNPNMKDVVKAEILKLLDAGIIYPISDSSWVSPVQVVPKKGGITVVKNEKNELIPTRTTTGWRVCIDYRKLNNATRKDHFPLPFIDQMLERLSGYSYYCFLDGYSGYNQIPIAPEDQEKTTFTCPFGTFAYKRMPFGLCNAPATFQRCMMSIFSDMVEHTIEVFMDDFSVFGSSFDSCLKNLSMVLQRCEETNLVLNWEKCHFMVQEGIVLGHRISQKGIEVDKAKIELIEKLPPPTSVKEVRSFLGHAGFYRRFIKDFSRITKPLCELLLKDVKFHFTKECLAAYTTLKERLTTAPIITSPDWNIPFELMCDASALRYLLMKKEAKPRRSFLRIYPTIKGRDSSILFGFIIGRSLSYGSNVWIKLFVGVFRRKK
ncbi:uncharacterized protein LOC120002571 [Tripterygium wilfordii]|uniref:uncharacterized protein LOC120002571 n=1 Tax=Tripterygium wilfordii TaxID=458696 RepID=UPI0018F7E7C1|nr:uncharacterized protein LOC120002571 [Tripterygium wilfordii]